MGIFKATRRKLGRAGAGALGLLGGGAARRAAAQGEVVADELRIINFGGFNNLDPAHAPEFSAQYLRLAGAAEGLMRFTTSGELETELARELEMLDPASWRIHLRPEVTFWSGRPAGSEPDSRPRQMTPALAGRRAAPPRRAS